MKIRLDFSSFGISQANFLLVIPSPAHSARCIILFMYSQDSHCSFCGTQFPENLPWPRRCDNCSNTSYKNPLPVAVLLLPVDEGVLTIRRAVEPRKGQLALPGGFIEVGESWQAAAARELYEEAGINIDPAHVTLYQVHSAPDGTVLIFGVAPPRQSVNLPLFIPTSESSERIIVTTPIPLAFPLHTAVLADYLNQ